MEEMAPNSVVSQMVRLAEKDRPRIEISIDGKAALAMEGDTLLVAILTNAGRLRRSEFGDGDRAGFCLMGACQDCWVWMDSGQRLRACTTPVEPNMRIITGEPDGLWPRHV